MTHSLFDLNGMTREQLEQIAAELNIKVKKSMTEEAIAFAILDAEAKVVASTPIAPKKDGQKRQTRQRREKKSADEGPKAEVKAVPEEQPVPKLQKNTGKEAARKQSPGRKSPPRRLP